MQPIKWLIVLSGTLFSGKVFSQDQELTPVIIIMADQLRADVTGGPLTPHINSLREDGVSFNRAYCAAPLCAPSRASFFTGRYPNATGGFINPWSKEDEQHGQVRSGTSNLYQLLEDQWDSYHIGKQHFFTVDNIDKNPESKTRWITQEDYTRWMKAQNRRKPGGKKFKADAPEIVSGSYTRLRSYSTPRFERYEEGPAYFLDHYLANECIAAIRNRDKNKPLMLSAMFLAPHPPFDIPEPYFSMVRPGDFTLPENVGQWDAGQSPLQLYQLTGFIGSRYSRDDWQEIWAKYLGLVKLLDDEVGRIIQTLKEEGLYDKALIVFTSDHGEMLGSHSLWQKMCMYEESVKVPLLLKLPANRPAIRKESDVPVSLVDVLPTLLDFNGLPGAESMDGRSLLPLLQGEKTENRPLFIQYDGNGSLSSAQRCIVDGPYKLIIDSFKDEFFVELYDVVRDPQERSNLILDKQHTARARDLFKQLTGYMKHSNDRITFPENLIGF